MAFFEYNARNVDGRQFRYPEFPEHYVYEKDRKARRERRSAACSSATPPGGALLPAPSHDRLGGARPALRTSGPSRASCIPTSAPPVPPWATALEETAVFASGSWLRALFAFILHFGPVGNPLKLWDDFKDDPRIRSSRSPSPSTSGVPAASPASRKLSAMFC
jgi:hypothetical protein